MSDEYPYNGRLSRWEEIAPGLAIVGVEARESPPINIKGPKGKFLLQDDVFGRPGRRLSILRACSGDGATWLRSDEPFPADDGHAGIARWWLRLVGIGWRRPGGPDQSS